MYCTNRFNSAADGRVKGPALRVRVKTCADPPLCAGLEQHFSLSSRPQESWAFGPPKAMKNGFCSATTLPGSAALPFVISTEAQRSGEICGSAVPSWKCFSTERSAVEGPAVSLAHERGFPCTGTRISALSPPQKPGAPYLPGFGRCGIPQVSPSSPSRADRSTRVPYVRTSVARISCYAGLATTTHAAFLKESRTKVRNANDFDRKSGIRGPKTTGEAHQKLFVADPAVCSLGPERSEVRDLPFFSPGTHTHAVRKQLQRGAALAAEGAASCRD